MPVQNHNNTILHSGLLPVVLGVTGHRDIREDDLAFYEAELSRFFTQLKQDYPNTPFQLLNPLAEGADRLVAHIAAKHKLELIIPLPLPEQEYLKDFPGSVDEYQKLRNSTSDDNCFELPIAEGNTPENILVPGEHRDRQYAQVGSYVTSHCHILIALWDGDKTEKAGGTAQVVRFNLQGTCEPCDPERNLLDPVDFGPVFHVDARRSSQPSSPPPQASRWLYPEHRGEKDYQSILNYIETFNSEKLRQHSTEPEQSRAYIMPDSRSLPKYDQGILDTYAMADVFAIHYQRHAHRALSVILVLAGAMALSFEIYAHLLVDQFVLALYPVFFLGIAGIYMWHLKTGAHGKYLDYRTLAEGLRVQFFWRLAGISESVSANYLLKQNDELQWIREALRGCNTLPLPKTNLDSVYRHWIQDQESYFTKRAYRQHKKLTKLEKHANLLYGSGLVVSIIAIVFWGALEHSKELHHSLIVFMGFTPVVAALWMNYAEKVGLHAQSKQYARFAAIFQRAREIFASLDDDTVANSLQKQKLIKDLGKEALIENGDWVLMRRERPIDIPKG